MIKQQVKEFIKNLSGTGTESVMSKGVIFKVATWQSGKLGWNSFNYTL